MKPPKPAQVTDHDLERLFHMAVRYALGRRTYVTGEIAEIAERYAERISAPVAEMIQREVSTAIRVGKAGHACDAEEWWRVVDVLAEGRGAEAAAPAKPKRRAK